MPEKITYVQLKFHANYDDSSDKRTWNAADIINDLGRLCNERWGFMITSGHMPRALDCRETLNRAYIVGNAVVVNETLRTERNKLGEITTELWQRENENNEDLVQAIRRAYQQDKRLFNQTESPPVRIEAFVEN